MKNPRHDRRVAAPRHTAIIGRRTHLAGYPAAALAVSIQPGYSIPVLLALGVALLASPRRQT